MKRRQMLIAGTVLLTAVILSLYNTIDIKDVIFWLFVSAFSIGIILAIGSAIAAIALLLFTRHSSNAKRRLIVAGKIFLTGSIMFAVTLFIFDSVFQGLD